VKSFPGTSLATYAPTWFIQVKVEDEAIDILKHGAAEVVKGRRRDTWVKNAPIRIVKLEALQLTFGILQDLKQNVHMTERPCRYSSSAVLGYFLIMSSR